MGATINNESTTTEPPPSNGQQPKPLGGLNAFYWYQIFNTVFHSAFKFMLKTEIIWSKKVNNCEDCGT